MNSCTHMFVYLQHVGDDANSPVRNVREGKDKMRKVII